MTQRPYVTHPNDGSSDKAADDAKKTLLRLHYPCRDGRVCQTFVGSTEKRRAMPACMSYRGDDLANHNAGMNTARQASSKLYVI
jgi:hypothetical protein